jgi:hypothetical protein
MSYGVPSSADMAALMGQLQKANSSYVGYQSPLVPAGGSQVANNISPLVPQQLAQTLSIATSSMNDLKLWPMLSKVAAQNTVVEYNRVLQHGAEHAPFIAEGGTAALNRSTYEKVAVQIKYMAERREVTDQASMVNIVGPSADGIAEETRRGTENLLRRLEKELFHGDSSLNPLAWDGIIKQIKDGGNVADLRGKAVDALYLSEVLGALYSAPFYGMISHILVTPKVLSELIKQTVHHGRHDQIQISGSNVTFGAQSISITGPYGPVPVVACPFLERHDRIAPALATSSVFDGTVTAPTISVAVGTAIAAAQNAASKFVAADAGAYVYRVVPVGKAGIGEAVDTASVAVVAGDQVTFTINQTNTDQVDFYRIYRSKPDAANADGALLVGEIARTAGATQFVDNNDNIAGCSEIVFVNQSPDYMCYYQMLSLVRRPLAQLSTSYPFLLMMFGAPAVKLPSKMFVVKNAGVNASSGLSGLSDPILLGLNP